MARKVNKQSVRISQDKRRREEARRAKERLRNRILAGVGGVLLIAVVVFYASQLRGRADETADAGTTVAGTTATGTADAGTASEGATSEATATEEVQRPTELVGTKIEGDRPLAAMAPAERNGFYDAYPDTIIDETKNYQAVIQTEKGDMVLNLFDDKSPLAVNNFVFLATQGFFDNVVFHRVLENFMAQGGDPTGTGTGGPGYQFDNEVNNGLAFDRPHLLAMANSGPNTNGSQFFITFGVTDWLTGGYTIFGELIQGEDVLNSLTLVDPDNPADADKVGDKIDRIDIYESDKG